ncbi:MAG: acetyl/propionyl/methylcrotonyl-CoA carboxylase subunit alpha [Alphaproteobacteria bacterium]|nr:acetyl/propionyl/methylcrotonyl-CoA carboxylase subunit alpha [Alphaproteobacteria bacterium]
MFERLLIANRGEIACRIIRTARRLSIATIAIYSDADRRAMHVELADEAWPVGPAPPGESYLNIDAILAAAQASGAEAVHPGYGFLSENSDFAETCEQAGLVFIGPSAAAIRAMGSKAAAKSLMGRAGVPVVPGYHGDDQDPDTLGQEAQRLGFPVLIKASAGGGGRGMRIVHNAAGFASALASARREALSAFGEDRMLIEKYLERPRHIEVQIFADRHGNIVHIFDRDCSIQRRHQKVIEEAPAPGVDQQRRGAMRKAAVTAARAIGYVGAGTVEFIVPPDASEAFYFIEMNTRLQVEHTVTEAVTGLDLVEWQLRAAAGEKLPVRQPELTLSGHAIEARLYAEDPEQGFLPQIGTLDRLHFPSPELARVETGVREGDGVSPYYDPMIAKIIVWGDDRSAAVSRLQRALGETAVLGLRTNLAFLARVARHPDFVGGTVDTDFVERNRNIAIPGERPVPDAACAAAALYRLSRREAVAAASAASSPDPFSPWARSDGWRLGEKAAWSMTLRCGVEDYQIEITRRDGERALKFGDRHLTAALEMRADGLGDLTLDGVKRRVRVLDDKRVTAVFFDGESWPFEEVDTLAPSIGEDLIAGKLTAPMPGRVARLFVEPGAAVRRGAPLVVIEAMKMEHTITAPADGVVAAVRFSVGELVEEGAELIALAPPERQQQR